MSQSKQILEKLNEHRWVCSVELRQGYTVDYRARINDLRKQGYLIRGEPCKGRCGRNHNANLNWWFLDYAPQELKQTNLLREHFTAGSNIQYSCCPSFGIFKLHNLDCPNHEKNKVKQGALNL